MDSLMDKQPGTGRRARRLPTRLTTGLPTDSPAFAHMPTGSGFTTYFLTIEPKVGVPSGRQRLRGLRPCPEPLRGVLDSRAYAEREANDRKASQGLEARDNFWTSKDNFWSSRDRN